MLLVLPPDGANLVISLRVVIMLYIRDMAPSARRLRLMKINDAEKDRARGEGRRAGQFGSASLL
jgi:hypothetical protein